MFPSPRRGPIFSTISLENDEKTGDMFPSPRRGPIFSTQLTFQLSAMMKQCFRPHEGDPSSLQVCKVKTKGGYKASFRPHEGDPSSLQVTTLMIRVINFVSVPTKGTHLLYKEAIIINHLLFSFRPHEGDPSSLRLTRKHRTTEQRFPSPRRGPIFSTGLLNRMRYVR